MLIAVALILLGLHGAWAEDVSQECLRMQGEYKVQFHGESFPYSLNTYTIRVIFEPSKKGLEFYNDHRSDLRLVKASQTLNAEDLTDIFQENTLFSEMEMHDCLIETDQCLASASDILKDLKIAENELVSTADSTMKSALSCAIERVRYFAKKVRTEARYQKGFQAAP